MTITPPLPHRDAVPYRIARSTEISSYAGAKDMRATIERILKTPEILSLITIPLEGPTNHRPRIDGQYELLYLAFVVSRVQDVKPFHDLIRSDVGLWQLCGFQGPVSYATLQRRFAEIESHEHRFGEAIAWMIGNARQHEPAIGAYIHVDSSEAQSQSQLRHACRPEDDCPTAGSRLRRLGTDEAKLKRHENYRLPEEEADKQAKGFEYVTETYETPCGYTRTRQRVKMGNHYFTSTDPDAGTRAYYRKGRLRSVWHGYYSAQSVDHVTKLPICTRLYPANRNEADFYPDLIEHAMGTLGFSPHAVVGDTGFSTKATYEWNTRRQIASVFPWRGNDDAPTLPATDQWDEDGVPRCAHCGGGTNLISTLTIKDPGRDDPDRRKPILRVKCALPKSADCDRVQVVSPSHEWRALLPLWRTHPAYHELEISHDSYESVHNQMRELYHVAPNAYAIRPKRVGIACQQLRATGALLVMWTIVSEMHGWLKTAPAGTRLRRVVRKRYDDRRKDHVWAMNVRRRAQGLVGGHAKRRRN